MWKKKKNNKGFTLLEMLVVVTLLGTLAGVTAMAFRGDLLPSVDERLVRAEMREIARAIQRFRQDTGYYPGEGPFGADGKGYVPVTSPSYFIYNPPSVINNPPSSEERRRWLESPANFHQLLATESAKVIDSSHPLSAWNPETGRGWRGPYIEGFHDGAVVIGDDEYKDENGNNDIELSEYSPERVANGRAMVRVPGLADPFMREPKTVFSGDRLYVDIYCWKRTIPREGGGVEWSESLERWGSPYLFLKEMSADSRVVSCRLLSLGPDGKYKTNDDIELIIQ